MDIIKGELPLNIMMRELKYEYLCQKEKDNKNIPGHIFIIKFLSNYELIKNKSIVDFSRADFLSLLNSLNLRNKSVFATHYGKLLNYIDFLNESGYNIPNPNINYLDLDRSSMFKKSYFKDFDQIFETLNEIGIRLGKELKPKITEEYLQKFTVLVLLTFYGIDLPELITLKFSDISLNKIHLQDRVIEINNETANAIMSLKKHSDSEDDLVAGVSSLSALRNMVTNFNKLGLSGKEFKLSKIKESGEFSRVHAYEERYGFIHLSDLDKWCQILNTPISRRAYVFLKRGHYFEFVNNMYSKYKGKFGELPERFSKKTM